MKDPAERARRHGLNFTVGHLPTTLRSHSLFRTQAIAETTLQAPGDSPPHCRVRRTCLHVHSDAPKYFSILSAKKSRLPRSLTLSNLPLRIFQFWQSPSFPKGLSPWFMVSPHQLCLLLAWVTPRPVLEVRTAPSAPAGPVYHRSSVTVAPCCNPDLTILGTPTSESLKQPPDHRLPVLLALSVLTHPYVDLCFWTVVLEKTWDPWTSKRSNQSILKEISPEYSLEGLMLKLQNFGHLMGRTDSLEKTLMLGKIEGRRRRGQQRKRWLDGITDSMDMSLSKLQSWWWTGKPGALQSMGCKGLDATERLNWTDWPLGSEPSTTPRSRSTFPPPFSSASMIYSHDLIALSLSMTEKSQMPVNPAFKYSVPRRGNGCSRIKSTRLVHSRRRYEVRGSHLTRTLPAASPLPALLHLHSNYLKLEFSSWNFLLSKMLDDLCSAFPWWNLTFMPAEAFLIHSCSPHSTHSDIHFCKVNERTLPAEYGLGARPSQSSTAAPVLTIRYLSPITLCSVSFTALPMKAVKTIRH